MAHVDHLSHLAVWAPSFAMFRLIPVDAVGDTFMTSSPTGNLLWASCCCPSFWHNGSLCLVVGSNRCIWGRPFLLLRDTGLPFGTVTTIALLGILLLLKFLRSHEGGNKLGCVHLLGCIIGNERVPAGHDQNFWRTFGRVHKLRILFQKG